MALTPAFAIAPGLFVPVKGGLKKALGWIADYIFQRLVIQGNPGSEIAQSVPSPVNSGADDLRHLALTLASLSASALLLWMERKRKSSELVDKGSDCNDQPQKQQAVAREISDVPEVNNGSQASTEIPRNEPREEESSPQQGAQAAGGAVGRGGAEGGDRGVEDTAGNTGQAQGPQYTINFSGNADQAAFGNFGPVTFNQNNME